MTEQQFCLATINNPAAVAAVAIVIGTVFAWLLVDEDEP